MIPRKRLWLALTGIVLVAAAAAFVVLTRTAGSPPPAPVDAFASASGFEAADVHVSIPALPARSFSTAESAIAWQDTMRARLAELFSRPGKPAPFPLVLNRSRLAAPAGLVRERLQFDGADGTRIPAILQYPEGSTLRPAILVIPGHVPSDDSGLRQLVWKDDNYQRAAATALAQRGFVTLAFELRGFGLLGMREGAEHNAVAHNALLGGTFYKAIVTGDASRALAILRSLPEVDPRRTGVAGASMGGEIAITLAALDPSINAIAASDYGGHAGVFQPITVPDSVIVHYCHIIPGAWAFLRREDFTLLLAPRPTLLAYGGIDYKRDETFVASTDAAWRILGGPGRLELKIVANGGHEFFVEETAQFFSRAFAAR